MDNATNFTASSTQEFLKILGACPRFSTPYHPEGNGLRKKGYQRGEGRSWHRHIPFLLWAYREVPNATTGTPPFLLMYGRDPKGPLSILKLISTGNTLLPLNMKRSVEIPATEKNDEALDRVKLDYLSKKQQTQLKDLLHRHRTLFSGKIKRAEHVIKLKTEEETMKPKNYKIPENLKRKVDAQIDELLELGLIEPVVCVHNKDGTIRLCIDFRSLNALTVPDAYPIQNMMELNFSNLQAPTTKKQLRSALGLCNFYRQYIPNFAKIALPLTELTKKKVPNEIPWNKEAENVFKELKTALCGITEFQVPDIEKPYYLHTDASQTAVGCCLGQLDG
ncbi:retrovirus-related Pol polyprotein from transposon 17.6 [Trichonephila clavipes]|nr:retrovirus-related Pol polyprotein from transposon 17.6 [Trichonephila clavipes]